MSCDRYCMMLNLVVICASNCFAMNGGGCTQCLQGFLLEGLGCCNCAPDRVRVGDQCLCPPNQVVNPDTGECVPCPGDLLPVDSVCECPPGTLRIGIDCIGKLSWWYTPDISSTIPVNIMVYFLACSATADVL